MSGAGRPVIVRRMKILIAYDGFERSTAALVEGAKLARATDAEITVLSVIPPDARASKSGGHVGLAPHAHVDVANAHRFLREQGLESEMKTASGPPAEEIVSEATEGGYDLIVVGARARGALGKLGSVSAKVLRLATCPVLVAGERVREAATV
jgi:nucleotide-binding universal stress UspA family protein